MGVLCWVTGELWGGGSRCPRGPGTEHGTEPASAAGTRDPFRRLCVLRLLSAAFGCSGPCCGRLGSGTALHAQPGQPPHPPPSQHLCPPMVPSEMGVQSWTQRGWCHPGVGMDPED